MRLRGVANAAGPTPRSLPLLFAVGARLKPEGTESNWEGSYLQLGLPFKKQGKQIIQKRKAPR